MFSVPSAQRPGRPERGGRASLGRKRPAGPRTRQKPRMDRPRSFRGLDLFVRTLHLSGPRRFGWPIIGEPLDRYDRRKNSDIPTVPQRAKALAVIEDQRRDAREAELFSLGKSSSQQKDVVDLGHDGCSMRYKTRICQRYINRSPLAVRHGTFTA